MAADRPADAAVTAQLVRQLQQLRLHLDQEEARLADCESHVQACSASPWVRLAQLTASKNTLPAALDEVEAEIRKLQANDEGSVASYAPPSLRPAS